MFEVPGTGEVIEMSRREVLALRRAAVGGPQQEVRMRVRDVPNGSIALELLQLSPRLRDRHEDSHADTTAPPEDYFF